MKRIIVPLSVAIFAIYIFALLALAETPRVSEGAKTFSSPTIGVKFILIPAGTFTMGSPLDELGRNNDESQHKVVISRAFYLQTTEITQAQWEKIMGNNPSYFSSCGSNCPVENVSWNDVQEFIRRLNKTEKTEKYRLPTEAEWEYAARAGKTTAFANGGIINTNCDYDSNLGLIGWYCDNSSKKTHPVAGKKPNDWGLFDMHGNVLEWVQDYYGDYPSKRVIDPTGPLSGIYRVNRGGTWAGFAISCRAAFRTYYPPNARVNHGFGFRLCRTQNSTK